jgi:hypothetical protein
MISIPNSWITILTIPGVWMHVLVHQFICRILGIPVHDMNYFDMKHKVGYVINEKSDNSKLNLLITFGPYLIMNILSFLLCIPLLPFMRNSVIVDIIYIFSPLIMWFALSFSFHSLPSGLDFGSIVNHFSDNPKSERKPFLGASYISYISWLGMLNVYIWYSLIGNLL